MLYYTKHSLPKTPHWCTINGCIYQLQENHDDTTLPEGICEDPHINYGNGDALCYKLRPARKVAGLLSLYKGGRDGEDD